MKLPLKPFIQITPYKIAGLLLFFCCNVLANAYASSRIALVIGNGEYQSAPLSNPVNDASDMGQILQDLGFEVLMRTNVDRKNMRQVLREFGEKLKHAEVGLFYFAGHGIQIKGKNYLIPVKTNVLSADEVEDESIAADAVLRKMETAGNKVNIVILDACRNNPFARSFRNMDNGLARMEGPVGSYIAYATAPGSVASDGSGRNGLYTQYLLQALQQPGLTIEQTFKFVRNGVRADTQGKQIPWESSSLTGEFAFRTNKKSLNIAAISPPPPIAVLGHLQVVTNVSNAQVTINDQKRGLADSRGVLNISNVSNQKIEVVVTADGYQLHRQNVDLAPGQWKTISIQLQPLAKKNVALTPKKSTSSYEKSEAALPSCLKNQRILLSNHVTIQSKNTKRKRKSHSPELNAIISSALKKYQIEVIDKDDVITRKDLVLDSVSLIDGYKHAAKKYQTDYVLAANIQISEMPITTVKTNMKTMQGEVTLKIINLKTAEVLASNTHSFTKAGLRIRPLIKRVLQKEINNSVQQLIFESCGSIKTQRKKSFFQRAKNLLKF